MSSGQFKFDVRPQDMKRNISLVLIALGVVILFPLLSKSWYTVEANEKAVVLRFGSYAATSDPGLHFCIPFVDTILKANMRERSLRLPVGSEDGQSTGRISDDDTLMLTGDLNAASVEWSLQWRVDDPQQYLFTFHHDGVDHDRYLEHIIAIIGRTVMNRLVGDYSIDEVLTQRRAEIGQKALDATQLMLDQYECGISITALQMQRVTPPEQVKPSFAAVNEAVQTKDKFVNEANKERNTRIPKAHADRDKAIQEARGYADRRRAEVKGEIDALMAQYEQFAKAPDETRQRLYLESLGKVLKVVKNKTIIDSDLPQLLPLLNLNVDPHSLKEEIMGQELKAALVDRGLPRDATDAEAVEFIKTLVREETR